MQVTRATKLVLAATAVVFLGAACGGGETTDLAADSNAAAPVKAAADDCGFAKDAQASSGAQAQPKELTQADIDKAVSASPAEIKDDMRVFFQVLLDSQNSSKKIQSLPPQEQAEASMKAMSNMQSPKYVAALENIAAYTKKHCPEYASASQSPTQ